MIRTESEYRRALEQLEQNQTFAKSQRTHLKKVGLKGAQLERALEPTLSFGAQLEEEIETYEQMKRGELGTLYDLSQIGRWLIGVRIARGLSQKELAELLDVSEAQVSRDERNEYHGITIERAQRILQIMGVRYRIEEESLSPEVAA